MYSCFSYWGHESCQPFNHKRQLKRIRKNTNPSRDQTKWHFRWISSECLKAERTVSQLLSGARQISGTKRSIVRLFCGRPARLSEPLDVALRLLLPPCVLTGAGWMCEWTAWTCCVVVKSDALKKLFWIIKLLYIVFTISLLHIGYIRVIFQM